jgi:hypothetical protein
VEDLHGSVDSAVIQPPPDDRRRFTFDELIWGSGCIVDEEHTATRFQAVRHERPEGFKQAERYV